MVLMQKGT